MIITFQKDYATDILKAFNNKIDKEGYIVDKTTKQRVLTQNGEEIKLTEFAGILPGSEIYLKSDIVSLIKYIEHKNE